MTSGPLGGPNPNSDHCLYTACACPALKSWKILRLLGHLQPPQPLRIPRSAGHPDTAQAPSALEPPSQVRRGTLACRSTSAPPPPSATDHAGKHSPFPSHHIEPERAFKKEERSSKILDGFSFTAFTTKISFEVHSSSSSILGDIHLEVGGMLPANS